MTDSQPTGAASLPLAGLEVALNRLLALDPLTLERLAALQGRSVQVEVPALGLRVVLVPHAGGLQWLSGAQEACDVRISGSVADLLRAQLSGELHGLQIEGDKHLASALASALREAHIDWPQLLAPWLGDVATQWGAQALGSAADALRQGADSLLRGGAQFLQYEQPVLVSAAEWESFRARVRELHEAVSALERRIALLALRP